MSGADGSIIIDTSLDPTGFNRGSEKLRAATIGLVNTVNHLGQSGVSAFSGMLPVMANVRQEMLSFDNVLTEKAFSGYVVAAQNEMAALAQSLAKMGQKADAGFANMSAVESYQAELTQLQGRIDQIKERMAQLGSVQIETPYYSQLMDEIGKTDEKLEALKSRQAELSDAGIGKSSKEYKKLEQEIEVLQTRMANLVAETRAMEEAGEATVSGETSAEYVQLANALAVAEQAYKAYTEATQEAIERERAAGEAAPSLGNAVMSAFSGIRSALQPIISGLANFSASLIGVARDGLDFVARAAATATQRFLELGKNLVGTAFTKLSGAIRSAVQSLSLFGKKSNQTGLSAQSLVKSLSSLKRMLISRVKRMFISSLFREFGEAQSALAKYSSAYNAAMSGMNNASKNLSGNAAVAFSGLVNAIAPAVTTIISLISQAITYINSFFALLSGARTVTVAKKSTDDYTKSLKSAGGAAKDLNQQVFKFDELNKEQDDSGGGGGGGGAVEFEDVAINDLLPTQLMEYFEAIKAAIAAGEWESVGDLVADGLNTVITAIDESILAIEPKILEWTKNIARALNGFVSGLDWASIGRTVMDGMTTALGAMYTALTTFNFTNLGVGLGNMINGAIRNANWTLAGQTITAKWNALTHTLLGLITTTDWPGMGAGIGVGLMTAWDEIDFDSIENLISDAVNDLFDATMAFLRMIEWEDIGSDIAESINGTISGIEWGDVGDTINTAVQGILDFFIEFFGDLDWSTIGTSIGNAFSAIDWPGAVTKLTTALGEALGGLASTIWALIKTEWDEMVGWWQDQATDEDGNFIISGLLEGMIKALAGIGDWVKEHIFQPFIDGFKKVFGISSPSTVMSEQGGYLIEGLLAGIQAAWESVTEWLSEALGAITEILSSAWGGIAEATSQAWDGVTSAITSKFDEAKAAVEQTADGIVKAASDAWETAKQVTGDAWNNVTSTISTAFDGAKNAVEQTAEAIGTGLSNAWDGVTSTASSAWNGITSTITGLFAGTEAPTAATAGTVQKSITGKWTELNRTTQTKWAELKNTVTKSFTTLFNSVKSVDWKPIGSGLVSGVKSGVSNNFSQFVSWVKSKFSSVINSVKSVFGIHSPSTVFAGIGENLMKGLTVGVEDGEPSVLSNVKKMAQNIIDGMSGEADLTLGVDGLTGSLDAILGNLQGLATVFYDISNAMQDMGGLQVPAVAEGTVIPYRTRMATIENVDGMAELQAALANGYTGQEELMTDQRDILREIRDLIGRLNLTIDARSLTRAITSLQADNLRAYGGA